MKIYLAASYAERFNLRTRATQLEALGHEITSRWIYEPESNTELSDRVSAGTCTPEDIGELQGIACSDACHIFESNCIIMQSTEAPARGGRHFEMGIAYCLATGYEGRMRLIIIGSRPETVFYYLPAFEFVDSWDRAIELMT